MIKRAAKPAVIEQTFRRAVEHHTHPVQQVDNARRRFAHALDQRLIGQKIPAVNRVVKVFLCGVAFALLIFRGVDSTLRANRMRALYWHDGKEFYGHARLGHPNRRHQAGQSSAHYDDLGLSHFGVKYEAKGCQSNRKLRTIITPTKLKTTPITTPNCPAARCARTVAASPHLHKKFHMPTPR